MHSTTAKAGLATLLALALSSGMSSAAFASSSDWDNDGMSNTWEVTHKLNPKRAADAKGDTDRDGLGNLREYQKRTLPRDEDTDNDGQDDGDEAATRTNPRDADSDDDRIKDGDEDFDRDRIANEDEDDAQESCDDDDDDVDRDDVDDEDENELGLRVGDIDSDDDRVADGAEDRDRDGVQNEDEDDLLGDVCSGDRDGDGKDDEDEGDRYGTIAGYDAATQVLSVTAVTGTSYTFTLAADSEIEFEDALGLDCDELEGEDEDGGSVSDLRPGQVVVDIKLERRVVEEIELLRSSCA